MAVLSLLVKYLISIAMRVASTEFVAEVIVLAAEWIAKKTDNDLDDRFVNSVKKALAKK